MAAFESFKKQTLLNIFEGVDFSTKGCIDYPVSELVRLINHHPDYCTTSSCSGRLVLFYNSSESKGVFWTFVNHGTCSFQDVLAAAQKENEPDTLLTLKVEPFIMHICCRDIESARVLHQLSLDAGFRESGITVGGKKVMLAIRTTAFHMELPVARNARLLFEPSYLELVMKEANGKLRNNFERIDRFTATLKATWKWPYIAVTNLPLHPTQKATDSLKHGLSRYGGHALLLQDTNGQRKVLVSGGQGLENESKSSRHVPALTYDLAKTTLQSPTGLPLLVHAVVQQVSFQRELLLVSGGRTSPQKAAPCLQIYQATSPPVISSTKATLSSAEPMDKKARKKAVAAVVSQDLVYESLSADRFVEQGDIPSPRWGHAFLAIGPKQFVLIGGRDLNQIFDDVFVLSLDSTDANGVIVFTWTKLPTLSFGHCFFAAAIVPHPHFCETRPLLPYVLVHGGISSLVDPVATDTCRLLDLNHMNNQLPHILTVTVHNHLPLPHARVSRLGHAITSIGGKALLLTGGVSDETVVTSCSEGEQVGNTTVLIEYNVNLQEELELHFRSVTFHTTTSIPSVHSVDNTTADASGRKTGETLEATATLADQECRAHHSALFVSATQPNVQDQLLLIGGGMMSLAFGDHFCRSLHLTIGYPPRINSHDATNNLDGESDVSPATTKGRNAGIKKSKFNGKGSDDSTLTQDSNHGGSVVAGSGKKKQFQQGKVEKASLLKQRMSNNAVSSATSAIEPSIMQSTQSTMTEAAPTAEEKQSHKKDDSRDGYPVVLVSSAQTKAMKVLLEARHVLEKKVKIFPVTFTSPDELTGHVEHMLIAQQAPQEEPAAGSHHVTSSPSIATGVQMFALPIVPTFLETLLQQQQQQQPLLDEALYRVLSGAEIVLSSKKTKKNQKKEEEAEKQVHTVEEMEKPRLLAYPLYFVRHFVPPSSATLGAQMKRPLEEQVRLLLQQMLEEMNQHVAASSSGSLPRWQISPEAWDNLPHKYECVGPILMIPEHAFRHDDWTVFITAYDAQHNADDDVAADRLSSAFWARLGRLFQSSRVARKALIDDNVLRESKVSLLCHPLPHTPDKEEAVGTSSSRKPCPCQQDHHHLPGWVTVTENRLHYSFDLTKVMFCSGNNTERMRFATLPSAGEVVVDFYAGIGYFTLPLLAYGRVQHLYACEWNPNSLLALKHNLVVNGVSADRYTLIPGDNRLTSVTHHLVDLADRVSLGLLPTSTEGWILAARAIKPSTGGVIHVHENVHQQQVETWTEATRQAFQDLFQSLGKGHLQVTVLHLECVKSYAPRVYHYVLDLQCRLL